jgi:hypothetical protein
MRIIVSKLVSNCNNYKILLENISYHFGQVVFWVLMERGSGTMIGFCFLFYFDNQFFLPLVEKNYHSMNKPIFKMQTHGMKKKIF